MIIRLIIVVKLVIIFRMSSLGFIILRHVNSPRTGEYWKHSYNCVRKFYPTNKILIIDDNSNYEFINPDDESKLVNTEIQKSEYPARGELLPYIYFIRNKIADTAVILHDSTFMNRFIDFNCDTYKILWIFDHTWNVPENELRLLSVFNNKEIVDFYHSKDLWRGSFGVMTVVNFKFLEMINSKYDLSKLLNVVKNRDDRMALERVIACIFQKESPMECMFGNIKDYCIWGGNNIRMYSHLPIIKIWTGR